MVNLIKKEDGTIGYEVNGVLLKSKLLPIVGRSVVQHVGTDTYAYKIKEVAKDYSWFSLENGGGLAVLVTRKNSPRYGKYVEGSFDSKGKAKPHRTPYVTCMNYETFWIVDYEAKTEYDPSF